MKEEKQINLPNEPIGKPSEELEEVSQEEPQMISAESVKVKEPSEDESADEKLDDLSEENNPESDQEKS